jgi:hypothetical protein
MQDISRHANAPPGVPGSRRLPLVAQLLLEVEVEAVMDSKSARSGQVGRLGVPASLNSPIRTNLGHLNGKKMAENREGHNDSALQQRGYHAYQTIQINHNLNHEQTRVRKNTQTWAANAANEPKPKYYYSHSAEKRGKH